MNKLTETDFFTQWLDDVDHPRSKHQILRLLDQLYHHNPAQEDIQSAQHRLKQALFSHHELFVYYDSFPHPQIGEIFTAVTEKGLTAIDFGLNTEQFIDRIEFETARLARQCSEKNKPIIDQLRQYFKGQRRLFEHPIDLHRITEFQNQVYNTTCQVPYGQVVTYAYIAHKLDKPCASRAVGQALRRNPIPFLIPCHRVIASDGSLRGYKGSTGLEIKEALLQLESCQIPI